MPGNSLVLAVPPHVRPAGAGVRGAVVVNVVEEGLGDHLHLRALDPSPARREACQVGNRGLLDDGWSIRLEPGAKVSILAVASRLDQTHARLNKVPINISMS